MKIPSRKEIITFSIHFIAQGILFVIVYGITNWLASLRDSHLQLFLEYELLIPFLPEFIFIYFSIVGLFIITLFYLDQHELSELSKSLSFATMIAGFLFLLIPAEIGYDRKTEVDSYNFLFKIIHLLDRPYNLVPSLHITYSFLIFLWIYPKEKNSLFHNLYIIWIILICISVLVIHQHHLIDIISGIFLAFVSFYIFGFRKRSRRNF
ncbi:phosphatase PAP2 family protein [Leptospira sp. GIMC2001]|uniref:phosphatase PAP2 family protein n=1 Tax=Leptospira sp. GIMC2001 TaxID=1513297 RepID=UPI003FA57537